jgi:elongation factor Ts
MPAGSQDAPKDVVLLLQPYVKDESKTIQDLVTETSARTGENVRIRRFARFELGR